MAALLPFEQIKPEVITVRSAKSDAKFGGDPNARPMQTLLQFGIVNVNKPKGPSSHQVADMVKKIFGLGKAGHSGTLDPGVTGVLPVALSRATRITQALLPAGKEYIALMLLHDDVPEEKLRRGFLELSGKISQLPPVKSAVKRQVREREVYYAEIIEIKGRNVLFRFGCQGGTYVRKWIHDLGELLGTGAHMAQLTRTKAGPFSFDKMWTLQDIEDAIWYWKERQDETFLRTIVRPVEEAVVHLPKVWIMDSAVDSLAHGQDLGIPGVSAVTSNLVEEELVAVLTLKNELVALGDAKLSVQKILNTERGCVVKTNKVFIDPGVYPSMRREM